MVNSCSWDLDLFQTPIISQNSTSKGQQGYVDTVDTARDICLVLSSISFIGTRFNFFFCQLLSKILPRKDVFFNLLSSNFIKRKKATFVSLLLMTFYLKKCTRIYIHMNLLFAFMCRTLVFIWSQFYYAFSQGSAHIL